MVSAGHRKAAVVAALSVIVAGCGGGGSSGSDAPAAPTAPATSSKPTIATQPASVGVLTDGSATFTVSASGTGLSYQWQKNGVDIAGATAASYQTPAATYQDDGALYTVVVTNAGGKVTSDAVMLTLKPSANQAAYENLYKGSSSYKLTWNLSDSLPQASGTNYLFYDYESLPAFPLTKGPQIVSESDKNSLTGVLITPEPKRPAVLSNGAIKFLNTLDTVTYVGGDLRIDTYAKGGGPIAATEIRSNYETVALTGSLAATPADFAHYHYPLFSNPAILDTTRNYLDGASYIKFTRTNKGDRYNVFDCFAAVSRDAMRPCASMTTIAAMLANGYPSASDAATYYVQDGTLRTVDGVLIWVANTPRPVSAALTSTVQYRIYFELNGNVYTGALIKDGATLVGSSYVSNPGATAAADRITLLPFGIRMNDRALNSIIAAKKL